tara:strand:- start:415 stop:624 length:210 start_codon:yes stop_codon:yes gene_type:complete
MSDRIEDILYQAHDEGIYNEVMNVSKSLDNKHYWNVADKFEEAYNIVKTKKEKGYENTRLDKEKRSNKR